MFLEELEDLKNRYLSRLTLHLVFSQESTDLPLYGGRIGREKIGEFLGTLVDPASIDHAFVCGPHGVNDEAEAALLAAGVRGRADPHRALRHSRCGRREGRCSRCAKATPPTRR